MRSVCFFSGFALFAAAADLAQPPASFTVSESQRTFLNQYCGYCHNEQTKSGGMSLARVTAELGEKIIRKVRVGMMPPPKMRRADAAATKAFVASMESTIDRAAAANPNPGRPALHRLNRAEYANAIRDILALDVDAAALLPPDDSSSGFDNNADVLGVSPALLEHYLTASSKI